VNVVGHSTNSEKAAVILLKNAADVFVEAGPKVVGNHRPAVFGTEYDVEMQGGVGLRHGLSIRLEASGTLAAF
jgi:hypothetical protein